MILSEEQLNQTIDFLTTSIVGVQAIYLFGSGVGDDFAPESDVDLAVLTDSSIETMELWEMRLSLADTLGRAVDLVDLSQADTVFIYEIVSTGVRVYTSDLMRAETFEMLGFTQYFILSEDREEIIKEIQKSGTVYG